MQISIQQQAGLGDALFLLKAASLLADTGNEVHWYIDSHWWWLADSYPYPNLFFHQKDDLAHRDFCDFNINLQYLPVPNPDVQLIGKYPHIIKTCAEHGINVHMDHHNWQDYVKKLQRDRQREEALFNQKCTGLDKYVLVNNTWSSGVIDKNIYNKFNLDCPIVWLENLPDDTLLDWLKIYENASGIISVNTACDLLFDTFDSKAEFYYVHMRDGYSSYLALKDVYTRKPWRWINIYDNF